MTHEWPLPLLGIYPPLSGCTVASAFLYLYRRFGPPTYLGGSKEIAEYVLPTSDSDVQLLIRLGTQKLPASLRCVVTDEINTHFRREFERSAWFAHRDALMREHGVDAPTVEILQAIGPMPTTMQLRRDGDPMIFHVESVILAAVVDLFQPVEVRDTGLTLRGRVKVGKVKPWQGEAMPTANFRRLASDFRKQADELEPLAARENFRRTGIPDYLCQPTRMKQLALRECADRVERECQEEEGRVIS